MENFNFGKIIDFDGNIKFSNGMHYRSVSFSEKIQILPYFFVPTNPQNLMKSWKLSDFLEKYIIWKHFT